MTTVNKIEVLSNGVIQARLTKTAKSGHEASQENWGMHRGSAEPGADIDEWRTLFNEHFAIMGVTDIPADEWQKVKDHAAIAHTDEVIAAYVAKQAAAE